jgi:hypothetical protein
MKNKIIHYRDDWMTPPEYYNKLNKIYNFDFDPCPFMHNVEEWDGLKIAWGKMNFVNPPYSLKLKVEFIKKALFEFNNFNRKSIFLLPVSTSTKIFHKHLKYFLNPINDFVEGRIPFIGWNSKGQMVNWDLIGKNTDDTIEYDGKIIPLHIKNTGQTDNMLIKII